MPTTEQKAEMWDKVEPMLRELVRARDKLARNYSDDCIEYSKITNALTLWGNDGDALFACYGDCMGSEQEDMRFIVLAANTMSKIKEIIGEDQR